MQHSKSLCEKQRVVKQAPPLFLEHNSNHPHRPLLWKGSVTNVPLENDGSCDNSSARPSRMDQLLQLQGVWWIVDSKTGKHLQLVEIKSSYAIFDASPGASTAFTICYPLGGTDVDIVTLRSSKLVGTHPVPIWSTHNQLTRWKAASSNSCWKGNRYKSIPGYEYHSETLLQTGPTWNSSPMDVVRASLQGVQQCSREDKNRPPGLGALFGNNTHHSAAAFTTEETSPFSRQSTESRFRQQLQAYQDLSSFSLVRCRFLSPDLCSFWFHVQGTNTKKRIANHGDEEETKAAPSAAKVLFVLRRTRLQDVAKLSCWNSGGVLSLPQIKSVMDFQLSSRGKAWVIVQTRQYPITRTDCDCCSRSPS